MCLSVDAGFSDDVRSMLQERGFIMAWKFLCKHDNVLRSMHFFYKWSPGINESGRKDVELTEEEKEHGEICEGIHVYLGERTSPSRAEELPPFSWRWVKVKCYAEDFVAAEHYSPSSGLTGEAVFTKVELAQDEYDAAIAGLTNGPEQETVADD